MFKEKFKYFKRKKIEHNFEAVINLHSIDSHHFNDFQLLGVDHIPKYETLTLGMKSTNDWKVYELKKYPGLIFIVNPFTSYGQRYWIARSLADYSKKPSVTNLDSQNDLQTRIGERSWWQVVKDEQIGCEKSLIKKLRWATLGYHHNWDTKVYSDHSRSLFPKDLALLAQLIVKVTLNLYFNAEAGIVNYYLMDSFLNGHVDRSEPNMTAPLVSISFGQTALFLIGGQTLDETPEAVFLRSGDIVLMTGNSRLRYHGVPRIMRAPYHPWNAVSEDLLALDSVASSDLPYEDESRVTMSQIQSTEFWKPFNEYIKEARINLNVRVTLARQSSVASFRMQIFNISHLFATPVAAAATADTLNTTSRKGDRKRSPVALPNTNCVQKANPQSIIKIKLPSQQVSQQTIDKHKLASQQVTDKNNESASVITKAIVLPICDKSTNAVAKKNKRKRSKKNRNKNAAGELTSQVPSIESGLSNSEKSNNNVNNEATKSKVIGNMKEEVESLMASLETITSQRNTLEKTLNELREENDRLARNNEDLKDELKEMTDEALELSVEKQRLLSKIGTLKKQLLNRPK